MLAVVMDGGSQFKRPWDNEQRHRSPDNRGIMPTMTDLGVPPSVPQLHKMSSPSHMLPPIVTGPEQSQRQLYTDRSAGASSLPGAPQHPSHIHSSQDASSKRPRLYYDVPYQPEPGRGQPSAHSHLQPSGQERYDQQQWIKDAENIRRAHDACQNCGDSRGLVEKVVSGLERLEAELRQVLASSPLGRPPKQENMESVSGPNVAEAGLKGSLIWASNSVESSTRLVREFAASQRALPRITVANLGMPPAHEQPSAITSAPPDFARSFMDKHERDRVTEGQRRYGPSYQTDYQLRPPDSAHHPPSPHPTVSSGSVFGANSQSPMGMGASGRMLPSPSSLHGGPSLSSAQGNYSPNSGQSAHSTHLQDLQHQISTKSLALTTLQREHDQLLAAYSRMQIRCQTLDKKSQVSDHEINTLTEEKIRLQSQVEAFEVQVEELVKARDEAQKQTTANGAQYMRIMSMSSKLQIQGAEEAKRYKQDREAWERDREGLQRRIEDLEAGRSSSAVPGDPDSDVKTALGSDDILASASLDVLRKEVVRLRQSLLNMERMFQDLRQETETIDHVIIECTGIRDRLNAKNLSGEQTMAKSTGSPVAEAKVTPTATQTMELETRGATAEADMATDTDAKAAPNVTEMTDTEAQLSPAMEEVTISDADS